MAARQIALLVVRDDRGGDFHYRMGDGVKQTTNMNNANQARRVRTGPIGSSSTRLGCRMPKKIRMAAQKNQLRAK